MLRFSAIGNLGSDARIEESNGTKFVSFNIGHNDRYTDAQGVTHESTQWISCALNGDGGKLLPYLTKGRLVFVEGRGSARVYSSPTLRRMVAGLNISVDRVELLGGNTDPVPRSLITEEGEVIQTNRAFYIATDKAKELGARKGQPITLHGSDFKTFTVDYQGWVTPAIEQSAEEQQQNNQTAAGNE